MIKIQSEEPDRELSGRPDDVFTPVRLTGHRVKLIPLQREHEQGLIDAAMDGELWRLWYTSVATPDEMRADIERRLKLQSAGSMIPFTVVERGTDRIVGMTTFMNIDKATPRVEIGSTWYARRVHRTALNTEAKLMLLRHAFETMQCLAVEFRTHFLNHQSRRAIERLGARFDGVLRNHQRARNGTIRDTCVYSVIVSEWPTVRSHLTYKLGQ